MPSHSSSVSVIIPAYNYAQYLSRAVDSVLNQSHLCREVIVVDDGSTDNTAEVLARYGDRIRYVYQKNAGLSAARNTGIREARSEFVAFLDADDEWLPDMLEHALKTFSELPAEFGVVACGILPFDAHGAMIDVKMLAAAPSREITCREILLKTRFAPSTVVARRRVFEACGNFDTTLRSSEDRDMWIRVAARYRIFLCSNPLARLRRHSANMSKNADRMKSNVCRMLSKSYQSKIVSHSAWIFWLQVYSFHFFQNAWRFKDEKRFGKAIKEMAISILLWPFFAKTASLNEPPLFRLRSLARFIIDAAQKQDSNRPTVSNAT